MYAYIGNIFKCTLCGNKLFSKVNGNTVVLFCDRKSCKEYLNEYIAPKFKLEPYKKG